jgi:hypothetical protein
MEEEEEERRENEGKSPSSEGHRLPTWMRSKAGKFQGPQASLFPCTPRCLNP